MKKVEEVFKNGEVFKENQIYTVVLKSGSTHNFSYLRDDEVILARSNGAMVGNIAIEKSMVLTERKNSGKCDILVGNWQEISKRKDIEVVQMDYVFVCVPRIVMIPFDNIGLIEESALPGFTSVDLLGDNVNFDNQEILSKLPQWKHYYSEHLDGFYSTPPVIKGQMKNVDFSGALKKIKAVDTQSQEVQG